LFVERGGQTGEFPLASAMVAHYDNVAKAVGDHAGNHDGVYFGVEVGREVDRPRRFGVEVRTRRREGEYGSDQCVPQPARDRLGRATGHERMAAEHCLRTTLFRPAVIDQHRRFAVPMDGIVDFRVRHQFDFYALAGLRQAK